MTNDPRVPQQAADQAWRPVRAEEGWRGPVVGVIGGLGPAATVSFLDLLVDLTPAASDQDHLDMVVLNHAGVPDRTAHIRGVPGAADPGPVLAADAARLEALGCAFIVLPCNTAHHYGEQMHAATSLDVVSIVGATATAALERARGLGSQRPLVGVLATDGTREAGVYQRALAERDADVVLPEADDQAQLMHVIYDQVKAGKPGDVEALLGVIDRVRAAGADVVVLGCTELSVIHGEGGALAERDDVVDSLDSLARATLHRAGRAPRA